MSSLRALADCSFELQPAWVLVLSLVSAQIFQSDVKVEHINTSQRAEPVWIDAVDLVVSRLALGSAIRLRRKSGCLTMCGNFLFVSFHLELVERGKRFFRNRNSVVF